MSSISPADCFVDVCPLDVLPLGMGRAFVIEGRSVALFHRRSGAMFAVDNACPHKGGPLAEGMLAEGRVVCPMHARRYDGITGECDQPGECSVRVHSVTIANGIVRVGIRGDGQDSEGVG